MVRRRDDDGLVSEAIEILNKAVHDSLQLAELLVIAAQFRDRIELVEKQNAWGLGGKVEERADIFAVLPRNEEIRPSRRAT